MVPVDKHHDMLHLQELHYIPENFGIITVVFTVCRAEEKGGLREFQSARVTMLLQEINAGLRLQKSCPGLLKNALAHEAVRSTFAH